MNRCSASSSRQREQLTATRAAHGNASSSRQREQLTTTRAAHDNASSSRRRRLPSAASVLMASVDDHRSSRPSQLSAARRHVIEYVGAAAGRAHAAAPRASATAGGAAVGLRHHAGGREGAVHASDLFTPPTCSRLRPQQTTSCRASVEIWARSSCACCAKSSRAIA